MAKEEVFEMKRSLAADDSNVDSAESEVEFLGKSSVTLITGFSRLTGY